MSGQEVELEHRNAIRFRDAHNAMNSGDLQPFIDMFADNIEWWDTGASQPTRGKTNAEARLGKLNEFNTSVELHDLFANDEHLVALVHASARRQNNHLNYSTAEVYHLSADGLITKRQAFAQNTQDIADFFAEPPGKPQRP